MIYFDNSATTSLSPRVAEAMSRAALTYANPSSLHTAGREAAKALAEARSTVLCAMPQGCELIFTGSGSEANNLALAGAAFAKKHFDSKRIITTDSEHPSVAKCADFLASSGFETVKISTRGGKIDLDMLEREVRRGAFAVSLMLVNNETGAYYDIDAAARLVRESCPSALLHCDAVQGFCRVPLPPIGSDGVDMITVSAHKIHGPKGVGALAVSRDVLRRRALSPLIRGGSQEGGLRAGTENTICIAGFAEAVREQTENASKNAAALKELCAYAVQKIGEAGGRVNEPLRRAHHIVSVTLPGIKSQTALNFFSARGICVSSGSACSSKDKKLSAALLAFGLSPREADATVRVSLSCENTASEVDAFCEALHAACTTLVKMR